MIDRMIRIVALATLCALGPACDTGDDSANPTRRITVLYTNDEHGWMLREDDRGGAAELRADWNAVDGLDEAGELLILSGGDMWTGPAISTWFEGQSMAETMNVMGYDAAAIGNHEFDFGLDGLQDRIDDSAFPFLSANMRNAADGSQHHLAQPFVVLELDQVRVGIIGLTTTSADDNNFPDNVAGVEFIDYETALHEVVPQVRDQGAEVMIVIAHICSNEMFALAPLAAELGISVIGGGHCHELLAQMEQGVALIEGGSYLSGHAKAVLEFDGGSQTVNVLSLSTEPNQGDDKDPPTEAVVQSWQDRLDEELADPIGYVQQTIGQHSDPMFNMITDSWLLAYPAQISLLNKGGVRQSMPAGEITVGTIVGIMPFENYLYEIDLTGSQIISSLGGMVVGGMTTLPDYALADGTPLNWDSTYSVLTLDYVYMTSDRLPAYDPTPYETSIHWRQPVIDWIRSLGTSPADPLDNYLDYTPRQ